ncbi:16717_t:CDS:2 [Entrophospora sp. SA101]|nr:16717_t:CDS:2 [Entrophospora sp. SA101]
MNSDISNSTGSVGRRFTEVWEHVTKGREISRGHYEGTCNYCEQYCRYFLILGKLGTGKTTLIQSTILNLQEPKGVVHFVCPSNVKEFAKNLAQHLNCELYPFKLRDIVVPNAIRKEQDNHSEYSNWNLLSIQLLDTTYNYMKKYKHPMVLILDQVDRIVMNDQKFIEILQDFAKDCADESSLIVVFIASEGLVPQIMRYKGLDLIDSEELELDESDTGSSSESSLYSSILVECFNRLPFWGIIYPSSTTTSEISTSPTETIVPAVTEAVGGTSDEMSDACGSQDTVMLGDAKPTGHEYKVRSQDQIIQTTLAEHLHLPDKEEAIHQVINMLLMAV